MYIEGGEQYWSLTRSGHSYLQNLCKTTVAKLLRVILQVS